MSLSDLPPRDTRRWVASRKAAVVTAVCEGLLTEAEAFLRYDLSSEELDSWKAALADHGVQALHVRRGQRYRKSAKSWFCEDLKSDPARSALAREDFPELEKATPAP